MSIGEAARPRSNAQDTHAPRTPIDAADFDLVSVDVFDTLLRRKPVGERERLLRAAEQAVRDPALAAPGLDARRLFRTRLLARRIAYRVAAVEDPRKDVRLDTLLARVCALLGLPPQALPVLVAAELEQDARAVVPDRALLARLQAFRAAGKRVVALSDTAYSALQLTELLQRHGCLGALDAVLTSADLGVTKRGGAAFAALAARERVAPARILHLGDDALADGAAPRAQGIRSIVIPKSLWRRALHRGRAAWFELVHRPSAVANGVPAPHDLQGLFGPIVAEHCLALWLYFDTMAAPDDAAALFCARGGLRIRLAFDTAVARLGLPMPVRTASLMVSRLVAVRGALLRGSPRAHEEMAREFVGDTCATVARALAGQPVELDAAWNVPFTPDTFNALMRRAPVGAELLLMMWRQQRLFERHLAQASGGAQRLVLCDTGLFASTQRLLEHGVPDRQWESALFARCNYKGFDAAHFARATGLVVERDRYSPFDRRSSVLRYWHLVEALFEPDLESVRLFDESDGGRVIANLERPRWTEALEGDDGSPFAAAMAYLRALQPGDAARVQHDAARAWAALGRTIRFPSAPEADRLDVGARSIDFGRSATVEAPRTLSLGTLRASLWREGLIAREARWLRWPALALLEAAHVARHLVVRTR